MAGATHYDSATNDVASVTIAALENVPVEISSILTSYSAAPTGGKVTIESPAGTTICEYDVTAAGPAPVSFAGTPLPGADGEAVVVKLAAAGGVGIVGKLTVVTRE